MAVHVRIGVCGTAHWAQTVHLVALEKAEDVRLVSVFGRNPARLDELSARHGIEAHQSFDKFLETVDAVSFAVPPAVQSALALKAAEAGKHLIVEKPISMNSVEATAIATAVRSQKLSAVCFLTRNFIPELSDFIARVRTEEVISAEASFLSNALRAGSPYERSVWRQEENATLWDVMPHLLTTLENTMGLIEAIGIERTADGGLQGRLVHQGGRTSTFNANQRLQTPLRETLLVQTAGGERLLEGLKYDRVQAFGRAVELFVRGIHGDAATTSAFEKAVRMVDVLTTGEASLKADGKLIEIPWNSRAVDCSADLERGR